MASRFAGPLQHLRRHVESDRAPARSDSVSGQKYVQPGPGAQVDHHLTGLQASERNRVPAAEAQVRSLRERREPCGAVATPGCNVLGLGSGRGLPIALAHSLADLVGRKQFARFHQRTESTSRPTLRGRSVYPGWAAAIMGAWSRAG